MITLVFPELLIFVQPRLMVKLADNPTHRSENRLLKKGEKPAMTASSAGHPRWTDEMLDELADSVSELRESVSEVKDSVSELRESVSELRESVSEVKDSVEGLQLTAQALLQIAAQQQRENEARQAEIAEIRQRQEESDKRFEVLLSEVRYLIRQIKPENQS